MILRHGFHGSIRGVTRSIRYETVASMLRAFYTWLPREATEEIRWFINVCRDTSETISGSLGNFTPNPFSRHRNQRSEYMITELTPEQIAMQAPLVEERINWARRTESLTMDVIEEGVQAMYRILELNKPQIIVEPSPQACWRRICEITDLEQEKRDKIILPGVDGFFEAGFFAFYDYFAMIGVVLPDSYHEYRKTADLNFYWCLDDVCVVCDRSRIIEFGAMGLHNEAGPAMEWRDGEKCWMINGIGVDEQIVMHPETQTLDQLQAETNEDVKAIRIDRYGWLRYLGDVNAEVLDERSNDTEGTYEVLYKTNMDCNIFVCTCMTGKIPALTVPSSVTNCTEAQLWLIGGQTFKVLART